MPAAPTRSAICSRAICARIFAASPSAAMTRCAACCGVRLATARAFSYALAIKEILVWGDTAVVRLTWTLTVRPRAGGRVTTSVEPGLDIFRRQRDGHWRIVRYLAYAQ